LVKLGQSDYQVHQVIKDREVQQPHLDLKEQVGKLEQQERLVYQVPTDCQVPQDKKDLQVRLAHRVIPEHLGQ